MRDAAHPAPGRRFGNLYEIATADDFAYTDPIDHSTSQHQGVRLLFTNGSRIVLRLSGTGTKGATLRVYYELYEPDGLKYDQEPQVVLRPLFRIAEEVAGIAARTGRGKPDVTT